MENKKPTVTEFFDRVIKTRNSKGKVSIFKMRFHESVIDKYLKSEKAKQRDDQ